MVGVAQLVELLVVVQAVAGSSPVAHPPEVPAIRRFSRLAWLAENGARGLLAGRSSRTGFLGGVSPRCWTSSYGDAQTAKAVTVPAAGGVAAPPATTQPVGVPPGMLGRDSNRS